MTKKYLLQLLGKLCDHEINIDEAFNEIDADLEVTDDALIYALYLDYNEPTGKLNSET